jgi:Cysteine-rich secretory protein family
MPTPDLPKVEAAIVQLTNVFRKEQGLAAVQPNAILRKAADDFARYLARTNTFSHTADGRQPGDRAKAGGYEFCIVAENLASNLDSRGFESQQLARDAVEGWKNSPGHRKNMVQPHVTEIAVAVAKAPGEEKYLSVQLFGRPASTRYEFTVKNASEVPVAYTFEERKFDVEGRRIITHTECVPGKLSFASAGSWLTKQTLTASFSVKAGAMYLIEPAGGGQTVKIAEMPAPVSAPSVTPARATLPTAAKK